jgi:LacI family transcriptional regulator
MLSITFYVDSPTKFMHLEETLVLFSMRSTIKYFYWLNDCCYPGLICVAEFCLQYLLEIFPFKCEKSHSLFSLICMNTSQKITIKEVAEKSGVSAMTVSRVIRNQGHIADETKEKVLQVIQELGYVPLQSARNLSGSFPRVIGIVIPSYQEFRRLRQGYEYEYALMIGALNICNQFGYAVNILEIRDEQDVKMLVKRVTSRQIGAYIVAAPATEYPNLTKTLKDNDIIHSRISAYKYADSELVVMADEKAAAFKMTKALIDMGHEKFAFIGGASKHRASIERQQGFIDALENFGNKKTKFKIYQSGVFFEDGHREALSILKMKDRPTAVHCLTDDIAAGVISAANELGFKLPEDLSICGFDNFGLARKISPSLTTAVLPAEEMAEMAAQQVICALEKKEQNERVVLNCEVIFRNSIACRAVR